MRNRRGLLQLEGLTERIVPAVSIRAVDGDLLIKGTPNNVGNTPTLAISVTADNVVSITDGSTNRGTYSVDGDLILNLSNRNDSVTITLSGGDLEGGIIANLLNGNDSLKVTSTTAARTILGGITVDGGNGNDGVTVWSGNAGGLQIQGGITFNGGSGLDTATLNGTNAVGTLNLGNNQTLTRVNTVAIGTVDDVSVSGSVIINASTDKLIPTNVTVGDATTAVSISGLINLTGTESNDTVSLTNVGLVNTVPSSDEEDEVYEISINLGRSSATAISGNVLNIEDVQFGDKNSKADFLYTGGKGKDEVNITGVTNFTGDARFTLGDGANEFTVVDAAGDVAFEGDITITGGKSTDSLQFDLAVISGALSATLGEGNNDLASAGEIAGGFTYSGGAGADNIELTNCDELAGTVTISLGGGSTSCEFSGTNGTTNMDSFTVDLGASTGTIDYAQQLDSLIVFLNPGVVTTNSDAALN